MKRQLLALLLLTSYCYSQDYTLVTNTPFNDVSIGSIEFADVDGDLDNDLFITGSDNSSGSAVQYSKLFINDGVGNFTESTFIIFIGLDNSSTDFEDIDGDLDLDLILNGRKSDGDYITSLFTNDGSGNFTEVTGTNFNIGSGRVNFEDIDGDLDQDLLIIGNDILELYSNDGSGNFTPISNTLIGTDFGDFEFFDMDGDLDSDVLITGQRAGVGNVAKLYENNGNGGFSEVMNTPFTPTNFSSIDSGDIDNDNDIDIIITGLLFTSNPKTQLFLNDGSGNFSEVVDSSIENVGFGDAIFEDMNDDNSIDVLLTGQLLGGAETTKLYLNDGLGNFNESTTSMFEGLDFVSSLAAADIDGDTDIDFINIGTNSSFSSKTNLYLNNLYALGLDEETLTEFKIYPNPSKDIVTIESLDNNTIESFSILDINGRLIKQEKSINNTFHTIDLSSLAQGTYLLELKTISSVFRKKILKN